GLRLIRALPGVPGLIATIAGGSRRVGPEGPTSPTANLIPASGDRDHTTSPSAAARLVCARHQRPSHPALHVWRRLAATPLSSRRDAQTQPHVSEKRKRF